MSLPAFAVLVPLKTFTVVGRQALPTLYGSALLPSSGNMDLVVHYSFLGWLLMGALAGWLSGEITRGKGFGCLGNTLLGLIGAVIGGWLFRLMHIVAYGFIGELAAATVGAVVLVAIARTLSGSN
jgi:uncharacterized membrane protein YeaQ/YmgE (transglycosylase-associated protein family)